MMSQPECRLWLAIRFSLLVILVSSRSTVSASSAIAAAFILPVQISPWTTIPRNDRYIPLPPVSSSPPKNYISSQRGVNSSTKKNSESSSNSSSKSNTPSADFDKAPTFDGKMVFPTRALTAGLAGHTVAAVYAIMNKKYKRGSDDNEWGHCEHIGYTRDLNEDIQSHIETYGARVAHIRALSFAYPQRVAMMEVASRWKDQVIQAGGNGEWVDIAVDENASDFEKEEERRRQQMIELMIENAAYEDDDDEFEYDDEDGDFTRYPSPTPRAVTEDVDEDPSDAGSDGVISPFANSDETSEDNHNRTPAEKPLFSFETVDKILDEVRPYLIQDGGNVSVQSVDMDTKNVYLVLEGACGSCPSSTTTMQLGIERVLRENFDDLGDVMQVEDPLAEATELTLRAAVEAEVQRISPAVSAMGGVVEILKVDPIGLVELSFRGPNRVQHGLELAIRDVPFVKHVKFVN